MEPFQSTVNKLSGTNFKDVHRKVLQLYRSISSKSKRRPYIRSAYFNKQKIFLDVFWHHLFEKENWRDKMRRLKYFPAAIDLIIKSHSKPKTKENPNKNQNYYIVLKVSPMRKIYSSYRLKKTRIQMKNF